jgi:nitrite reductase/ring-hydroxylating ferredoxin subunit
VAAAFQDDLTMGKFDDSITIACNPLEVRGLLSDLQRHPAWVPDGFKHYRFLSRETNGEGARAAVTLNLLGHWLKGELEVATSSPQEVVLKAATEAVNLDMVFKLIDRGGRTEVRMSTDYHRKMLPPWRVRTRIKQRLRLEQDVAALVNRFLSVLKQAAEASPSADERSSSASHPEDAAGGVKPASPGTAAQTAGGVKPASPGTAAQTAGGVKPASPGTAAQTAGGVKPASPGTAGHAANVTGAALDESADRPTGAAKPAPAEAAAQMTGASRAAATRGSSPSTSTEEFVTADAEAEPGPGQARVIKLGDREVAVFNIGGELHAIANACPHRGGPLAFGVLDGSIVTCPLHQFRFDVTTGQCPDIASLKVARYEVRRHDGMLQVRSAPIPA